MKEREPKTTLVPIKVVNREPTSPQTLKLKSWKVPDRTYTVTVKLLNPEG